MMQISKYLAASVMVLSNINVNFCDFCFVGPVACALCNRFGSRKIAMLGCLISFISLLASLAVENGSLFVVIFGLCGG